MLDQCNDVTVIFFKTLPGYEKSVQCVVVDRRVDFRIKNTEVLSVEITAYPGKQIGAVKHIDRDLQSFTDRRETAFADGFG